MFVLSPILVGSIIVAQFGMPEAERFSQALKDANVSGGVKDSVWTRESDAMCLLRVLQMVRCGYGSRLKWQILVMK